MTGKKPMAQGHQPRILAMADMGFKEIPAGKTVGTEIRRFATQLGDFASLPAISHAKAQSRREEWADADLLLLAEYKDVGGSRLDGRLQFDGTFFDVFAEDGPDPDLLGG